MTLNLVQSKIVNTLDDSVNVVAGAGTGKTYTLTMRIVESVKKRLLIDPEDEDPSGHIVAITFTKKAASELRSRVRSAFMEEASKGGPLSEKYLNCALLIDNSWISTIHSMAGRILRENAVEFKIDPDFVILSKQAEKVIFSQAFEKAIEQVRSSGSFLLNDFLTKQLSDKNSSSFIEEVESLIDKSSYLQEGLETVRVASFKQPVDIAKGFIKYADIALKANLDGEFNGRDIKNTEANIERFKLAIPEMNDWIKRNDVCAAERDSSIENPSKLEELSRELLDLLFLFPATTNKYGADTDYSVELCEYRLALKKSIIETASNFSAIKDKCLRDFSIMVDKNIREAKSDGVTKLSEMDTLAMCDKLLGETRYRSIVSRYEDKFDLIMLDEFQDTDKLQMSLIEKIAKKEPLSEGRAKLVNLCTVGDMQQSIYRFRGGDVELSRKRIESINLDGGEPFNLNENYRSHKDVLDAVEMIFSQPDVFGDSFLKLEASSGSLDEKCVEIFANYPRVIFDFVHGGTTPGKFKITVNMAREFAAKRVAAHFKNLKEEGVPPKEMALLLGKMKYAEVYANALREEGIECAITSGSLFSQMSEAKLVDYLLKYAVNVHDEKPLFEILTSRLFNISDDALLLLCRETNEDGSIDKRRLSSALLRFDGFAGFEDLDAQVRSAKTLLAQFVDEARKSSPAKAIRDLFAKSGWLIELEERGDAQSLVSAGTIKKAIDIVSDLEKESSGIADISTNYDIYLRDAKETPGTLVTSNSDFVQIITVHSSKGLEFKHVAVAEMPNGSPNNRSNLYVEEIDDEIFISHKATIPDSLDKDSKKIFDNTISKFEPIGDVVWKQNGLLGPQDFDTEDEYLEYLKSKIKDAFTEIELLDAMKAYDDFQVLQESRRLLYVALTRARESLYVSMEFSGAPEKGYKGVFDDIYSALCSKFDVLAEINTPVFEEVKMPIAVKRVALAADDKYQEKIEEDVSGTALESNDFRTIKIPVYRESPKLSKTAFDPISPTYQIASYSSLSEALDNVAFESDDVLPDNIAGIDLIDAEDDEMLHFEDIELIQPSSESEQPLDLGLSFHRLAQSSIIESVNMDSSALIFPEESRFSSIAEFYQLSDSQKERLKSAMELLTRSDIASRLMSFDQVIPEVPFNVNVASDECLGFVLEGEIDALGANDENLAFFIDYKTGNLQENSPKRLKEKYDFQAKCYSYALLMSGFENVEGTFVMVEKPVQSERGEKVEPLCIRYAFSYDDISQLKHEIITTHNNLSKKS